MISFESHLNMNLKLDLNSNQCLINCGLHKMEKRSFVIHNYSLPTTRTWKLHFECFNFSDFISFLFLCHFVVIFSRKLFYLIRLNSTNKYKNGFYKNRFTLDFTDELHKMHSIITFLTDLLLVQCSKEIALVLSWPQ